MVIGLVVAISMVAPLAVLHCNVNGARTVRQAWSFAGPASQRATCGRTIRATTSIVA